MDTSGMDNPHEQLARGIEEGEEWARSDSVTPDHIYEAMSLVASWNRGEHHLSSSRSRNDDARVFFDIPDRDGYAIGAGYDPSELFREGFVRGVAMVGDEQRTAALDQVMEDMNTLLTRRDERPPKDEK